MLVQLADEWNIAYIAYTRCSVHCHRSCSQLGRHTHRLYTPHTIPNLQDLLNIIHFIFYYHADSNLKLNWISQQYVVYSCWVQTQRISYTHTHKVVYYLQTGSVIPDCLVSTSTGQGQTRSIKLGCQSVSKFNVKVKVKIQGHQVLTSLAVGHSIAAASQILANTTHLVRWSCLSWWTLTRATDTRTHSTIGRTCRAQPHRCTFTFRQSSSIPVQFIT